MVSILELMSDPLVEALARISMPTKAAANGAFEFAKLARSDIRSCNDNYKKERYHNAAKNLQEAVEKAAKAFGLLSGLLKPTDEEMKDIGHDSFKVFIRNFQSFFPKVVDLINVEIETAYSLERDNVARGTVSKFRQPMEYLKQVARGNVSKLRQPMDVIKQVLLRGQRQIGNEVNELYSLDRASMWRASLNLDESNKWIKVAMDDVRHPVIITDKVIFLVELAGNLKRDPRETIEKLKLALVVGKTVQKLFPLSLLTSWHYEEAKYPTFVKYWNPSVYTKSAPFVREMPTFIKQASAAIDSAIKASEMALKISQV